MLLEANLTTLIWLGLADPAFSPTSSLHHLLPNATHSCSTLEAARQSVEVSRPASDLCLKCKVDLVHPLSPFPPSSLPPIAIHSLSTLDRMGHLWRPLAPPLTPCLMCQIDLAHSLTPPNPPSPLLPNATQFVHFEQDGH